MTIINVLKMKNNVKMYKKIHFLLIIVKKGDKIQSVVTIIVRKTKEKD